MRSLTHSSSNYPTVQYKWLSILVQVISKSDTCGFKKPEDATRLFRYKFRSMSEVNRKYSKTLIECVMIISTVALLHLNSKITRLTVRTEYKSMKWTFNFTDVISRLASCCLRISKFKYNVVYHADVKHQSADALSSLRTNSLQDKPLVKDIPSLAIDVLNRNWQQIRLFIAQSNNPFWLESTVQKSLDTIAAVKELLVEHAYEELCRAAPHYVGHHNFKRFYRQRHLLP